MDILFKLWIEATKQMTQNRTIRNPRINESAKSRLSNMYVVVVSCFHSILHLKTLTGGSKEMSRVLLFAEFICFVAFELVLDRKWFLCSSRCS